MRIFARTVLLVAMVPFMYLASGLQFVEAGFGITPPYVSNSSLTRNAVYEQQILLVRGDPTVAQRAEVVIDAPGFEEWIEVVEGLNIPLPQGQQKVPMTVRVTVPKDAEFKDYEGAIRIRTLPEDGQVATGAVSISLGALVDIRLSVIDKQIKDFRVRRVSVSDLNEGSKFLWLFFPGKIRFDMLIENTGNVDIAPSKVEFKIYDRTGVALLEETKNLNRITKVSPYATGEAFAEIPTRLPEGSYVARYKIYNDDEVKQEGDLSLTILPEGTSQAAGFGFIGLSLAHKISILLPVFSIIIAVLYVVFNRRKRHGRS